MTNTTDVSNLKEQVEQYLKNWKWFIISVILFIGFAVIYLRYATPKYAAKAKIQVYDDKSGGPGIDLFKELEIFSGGKNPVEDEIEIINSRSNFIEVVKKLGLNTRIIAVGKIVESELYRNPPVNVNFIAHDTVINKSDYTFYLTLSSMTTFGFSEELNDPVKVYPFGKNIPSPVGDIVITPNELSFEKYIDVPIRIDIRPINEVAEKYQENVSITTQDEFSKIVSLYLEDPIKEKGRDILNTLIKVYNDNAIEDKKIIADRTSAFINERIADIASNLTSVDQSAEDLKTSRGLTDIASEANINLNVGAENRQELASYQTQLNIAASMQDVLEQQEGYDVLPSNIGLNDPTIANTTERYNQLVMERKRLLKSSTEKSPIIRNLDQQLEGLKQSMQSSLSGTVNNLGMQVNTLTNQQSIINSKIYSAPRNERALRDITRKQQTTEALYLYLLQKREEAQIAVASTNPKSKIIDAPYISSRFPVSPNRGLVYVAAFLLGLVVPFGIIYLKGMMDTKVHNMHSLEKITKNVPVLGEIPKLARKDDKLVNKNDRSVLAEALRILRTNLDYLIRSKSSTGGRNNIIYVTSSVPGEGKTFLSSNLSMILSSTGKKVLLIGADIRNPKIFTFFGSGVSASGAALKKNKKHGLTEYLFNKETTINDILDTIKVRDTHIDIIYSGRIPPNPAELLLSDRLPLLINEASEKYDYVIVDTAPLMVVSDTLLIADYADHLIYVTRAGVTESNAIEYPLKLMSEGKIKGLSFVVNDVKASDLGYGGQYGYGYGKSHKKWWKF